MKWKKEKKNTWSFTIKGQVQTIFKLIEIKNVKFKEENSEMFINEILIFFVYQNRTNIQEAYLKIFTCWLKVKI